METILQDVRYALRTLARQPGFTGIAVFTMALGIGANTASYSVVDATLLRTLPFQDPGRLMKSPRSLRACMTVRTATTWSGLIRNRDPSAGPAGLHGFGCLRAYHLKPDGNRRPGTASRRAGGRQLLPAAGSQCGNWPHISSRVGVPPIGFQGPFRAGRRVPPDAHSDMENDLGQSQSHS
jgi:hypothetical protein